MNTKITFGKFKNWEVSELAKSGEAGRNYLAWGAENLRSEKWRGIFGEALAETQLDKRLAAQAISQQEGDISFSEALNIATEEQETAAYYDREKSQYEQAIAEMESALLSLGIPQKALSTIVKWIKNGEVEQREECGQLKFQSIDRQEFMAIVEKFEL